MTIQKLIADNLRYYWRTHLSVALGALVAAAVLAGALAVGDSVRGSLKATAMSRLGKTHYALVSNGRFFRQQLARDMAGELDTPIAPVLQLRASAAKPGSDVRVNQIQLFGVDRAFWTLSPSNEKIPTLLDRQIVLNHALARRLDVHAGDEILLRLEKPDELPLDAPLAIDTDTSLALRVELVAVAGESDLGDFSLLANQIKPYNAFVNLEWLAEQVNLPARANIILVADESIKPLSPESLNIELKNLLRLEDVALELRHLPDQNVFDLRSSRIFLDASVIQTALRAAPDPVGVFTYFVNELRPVGSENSTPYSVVSALGNLRPTNNRRAPTARPEQSRRVREGFSSVTELKDNEIIISQWLADDLQIKPNDQLEMTYYILGPMRKLSEKTSTFTVRSIYPMDDLLTDRNLMPDFPGLADAESCRDWKPGIPVDLEKLRDKDQQYWEDYRGTPKAFVSLAAAQSMWQNRFGYLTAVRYPAENLSVDLVTDNILRNLNPDSLGYLFQDVRDQAQKAASEGNDFGQIFLGFSFFLLVSALLLLALLFVLGIEQRSAEVGILLAVGFTPKRVRRILLLEGTCVALPAVLLGIGCGLLYTKALILGLTTVWTDAVGKTELHFHVQPQTLIGATVAGFVTAMAMIVLTLRTQVKKPVRALLTGSFESKPPELTGTVKRRKSLIIAAAAALAAMVLLITSGSNAAGPFFAAGALLLVAGLSCTHAALNRMAQKTAAKQLSLPSLALRNTTRRRSRSLAVVILLACGTFLIIGLSAFHLDSSRSAGQRKSGTGGFSLFATSSLPVLHDLNSQKGYDAYGLDPERMKDFDVLPCRVRQGDDASCLNLNRAQRPTLLGINPDAPRLMGTFNFSELENHSFEENPWLSLKQNLSDDTIPTIGDQNTVIYGLGLSLGAELPYTDEQGRVFRLRIVAMLSNSILQGSLIISENYFLQRFPSESGYRLFLIDAPLPDVQQLADQFSRDLSDMGMDAAPASDRLAMFNAVQNTYLSIFQVLGGLGLILGSVGLALVVLRNVLERRGEFAMLRAIGFNISALQKLVLYEHWALLLIGLACGVLTALLAVLPALMTPGSQIAWNVLAVTIAAVIGGGLLWVAIAARLALRGPLLTALRNE